MDDFKKAPKTTHKHKNLNQDDLQNALEKTFNTPDNHNERLIVRFDEDYNLNPEQTIQKLEEAGYIVEQHHHFNKKDKIRVLLPKN